MITFTDRAKDKVREYVSGGGEGCIGLRIRAARVGHYTFRYQMNLVREQDVHEEDTRVEGEGFAVIVDPQTSEWMEEARIDFLTEDSGSGFQISNPGAEPDWKDPVCQKVQQVIDQQILPALGGHGGWVELDRVEGDTAYIRFGGGCQGCAGASFTLKEGIESVITREVAEINRVADETDHGAGDRPFYHG